MNLEDTLRNAERLYLEAAPLIYYVEENPKYVDKLEAIIAFIGDSPVKAISSAITLTEVLSHPMRLGRQDLIDKYRDILLESGSFRLVPVTTMIASSAASMRSRYSLRTPDALHLATAIEEACDLFITNDKGIKRVTELQVLVLDELD
jgi:predicted nucleic acid-binding protein